METEQANLVTMDFKLGNHMLSLYVSPELFKPNQTTQLFVEAIKNAGITLADKRVSDIGSGVGPLAIYAALEDAESVNAVEIVEEQYDLLRKNIEKNNVGHKVTAYHGSFFDPIPDGIKADIIMADCSGMAEKLARVTGWYPPKIPTGGEDGAEKVISVLERAGHYLAENGKLYIPIAVCFSDREKILDTARARFKNLELRAEGRFPLPPKEKDVILEAMPESFKKGSF
ncbi:methyltransferase [Candidatus Pacearchaeota archaeon]|nr:methyltransferase [Candidatus Pacearchaeota archaeon]